VTTTAGFAWVRKALLGYVRSRRRRAFVRAVTAMAADPQIRAVNEEILRSFAPLDGESLPPP
jgi:hypothetical protein